MEHVVRTPSEPFVAAFGAIEVHQVPLWRDNLGWIVVCAQTREAAAVDGPVAGPVLDYAAAHKLSLTTILNTHTHADHIGINRDLQRRGLLAAMRVFGPSSRPADVPGLTDPVGEGDAVQVGQARGEVWLTEGHLDGHISFLFGDVLFCGDTLFGAGCGYLFDGPPAKMHASLQRIAQLPPQTRVCCAHEYTEDNLAFAQTVEPDNDALSRRAQQVAVLRGQGRCTVPFTVAEELATNPFLRVDSRELRRQLAVQMQIDANAPDEQIFAATRALKDTKRYKL